MSTEDKRLVWFVSGYAEFKLVILFGSQATGNATGDSDIDLALLADAPVSSSKKLQLVEHISAKFCRPIDTVDLFFCSRAGAWTGLLSVSDCLVTT